MISYKPLQKLLIDKGLRKTEFRKMINVSTSTLARFNTNEYISLEVIDKICDVLDCQPNDVMEFIRVENMQDNI